MGMVTLMRPIDADKLWMDIIRNIGACGDVLDIIERQPPIQTEPSDVADDIATIIKDLQDMKTMLKHPKPQWIPCSERLPEKYGWYLCTYKDGRVNTKFWNNKEWIDNIRMHMFELYDIRGKNTGNEVHPEQESVYWSDLIIAWMPLPEPYGKVEE